MFTIEEWKCKNEEILLTVKSLKRPFPRKKVKDWNNSTPQRKPEICCTCC